MPGRRGRRPLQDKKATNIRNTDFYVAGTSINYDNYNGRQNIRRKKLYILLPSFFLFYYIGNCSRCEQLAYNSPAGSLNNASLLNKNHLFAPKTQGRGVEAECFFTVLCFFFLEILTIFFSNVIIK